MMDSFPLYSVDGLHNYDATLLLHARRSNNALSIKWYCARSHNYGNVNVKRERKQAIGGYWT